MKQKIATDGNDPRSTYQIKAGPGHNQLTAFKGSFSVIVSHDGWKKWQEGMLIQDALPGLNAEEREFLLTGLTPSEWVDVFGQ